MFYLGGNFTRDQLLEFGEGWAGFNGKIEGVANNRFCFQPPT